MCKGKNKNNKYNQSIVKELSKKYEVSVDFVRKALSGARLSDTAESIKKDYRRADKVLQRVTQRVLDELINKENVRIP